MHIQKLISNMHSYTSTSMVYSGIIWRFFKIPQKFTQQDQILLASYSFKVIILALLETSDYFLLSSNQTIECSADDFIKFCKHYLEIFLRSQYGWAKGTVVDIMIEFLKIYLPNDRISDKPLGDSLKKIMVDSFETHALMQLYNSQSHILDPIKLMQTYLAIYWRVVASDKNLKCKNQKLTADVILKKKNIEPVNFLRSGFALFSIALQCNGVIDFDKVNWKDEIKCNVDVDSCLLFAYKTGTDLVELKNQWHKLRLGRFVTEQSTQEIISFLQKLQPIIHIENMAVHKKDKFFIPCPITYMKWLGGTIFVELESGWTDIYGKDSKEMYTKIGDAVEDHIKTALECIFEAKNVTKNEVSEESSADFKITLPDCNLIIEVKRSIGYATTLEETIDSWHRLCKAYKQCAKSIEFTIKKDPTNTKPLIPIIILFEEDGLTPASFQVFAERTNLAKDIGIGYIKIIPWSRFESILSTTSVSQFVMTLLKDKERYDNKKMTLEEAVYFPEFPKDTPAHSYQYLQEAANELQLFPPI